jgi:hypothetical protein
LFWDYTLKITRRNRRFDLLPNEHLPVVKVPLAKASHELPTRGRKIVSSEPLVGDLGLRGHGSGDRCADRSVLELEPRPALDSSGAIRLKLRVSAGLCEPAVLVETRRLELLTLSLQRRCSAN